MSSTKKRPLPIIRVFVSSTFSDLKHERNALHAQVWPELERYCQQRGFTFQAIDLRWGVPAEAGLDHRTMRICFEELRRSQETSPEPIFLFCSATATAGVRCRRSSRSRSSAISKRLPNRFRLNRPISHGSQPHRRSNS